MIYVAGTLAVMLFAALYTIGVQEQKLFAGKDAYERTTNLWAAAEADLEAARQDLEVERRERYVAALAQVERLDAARAQMKMQYEAREGPLLMQIQGMAERIATLKHVTTVDGDPMPDTEIIDGDVPFTVPTTEDIPYADELFNFIDSLDQQEARSLVEEYVQRKRQGGMDDVQILDNLKRNNYE